MGDREGCDGDAPPSRDCARSWDVVGSRYWDDATDGLTVPVADDDKLVADSRRTMRDIQAHLRGRWRNLRSTKSRDSQVARTVCSSIWSPANGVRRCIALGEACIVAAGDRLVPARCSCIARRRGLQIVDTHVLGCVLALVWGVHDDGRSITCSRCEMRPMSQMAETASLELSPGSTVGLLIWSDQDQQTRQ